MCSLAQPPFLPVSLQKSEWLCLNCQTKRLLEGSLGEPSPLPLPTSPKLSTGAPQRAAGATPPKQKGPPGPGQPSGPTSAKASPPPTKASPQAKLLRASEASKPPSAGQEKKTVKTETEPKPAPETTLPPGTPKTKTGARRTEPVPASVKATPEVPKMGEPEVSSFDFSCLSGSLWKDLPLLATEGYAQGRMFP